MAKQQDKRIEKNGTVAKTLTKADIEKDPRGCREMLRQRSARNLKKPKGRWTDADKGLLEYAKYRCSLLPREMHRMSDDEGTREQVAARKRSHKYRDKKKNGLMKTVPVVQVRPAPPQRVPEEPEIIEILDSDEEGRSSDDSIIVID